MTVKISALCVSLLFGYAAAGRGQILSGLADVDTDNNVVSEGEDGPFMNQTIKNKKSSMVDNFVKVLALLVTLLVLAGVIYLLYRVYKWY